MTMPDLTPVSKCPYRSPMAVSDAIADIIRDKIVCELGCAEGDNLGFMSRYAKKVFGVENDPKRYSVAQRRGFEVITGDFKKISIPAADVYYFWNRGLDPEFLLKKILDQKIKSTIVIGADPSRITEIHVVGRCARLGFLTGVPYYEGEGNRENGLFLLAIIDTEKINESIRYIQDISS